MTTTENGAEAPKKTVYVVEYNKAQREGLLTLLEDQGYIARGFDQVDRALLHMGWNQFKPGAPSIGQNLPDAIITNYKTGESSERNGLDLLEAAKERGIPSIITAPEVGSERAGITPSQVTARGGRDAHLIYKPFEYEDLLGTLGKAVQQGRQI